MPLVEVAFQACIERGRAAFQRDVVHAFQGNGDGKPLQERRSRPLFAEQASLQTFHLHQQHGLVRVLLDEVVHAGEVGRDDDAGAVANSAFAKQQEVMTGGEHLVHDRRSLILTAPALRGPQLLPVSDAAVPAPGRALGTAEADDAEQFHQPPLFPVGVFGVPGRGADASVRPRIVHEKRAVEGRDVIGNDDRAAGATQSLFGSKDRHLVVEGEQGLRDEIPERRSRERAQRAIDAFDECPVLHVKPPAADGAARPRA